MNDDGADFQPRSEHAAVMPDHLVQLIGTCKTHDSDQLNRMGNHLEWLWNNPDVWEGGANTDRWEGDPHLLLVELGVVFGTEYEEAYPTGRNDEWPIPLTERAGAKKTPTSLGYGAAELSKGRIRDEGSGLISRIKGWFS